MHIYMLGRGKQTWHGSRSGSLEFASFESRQVVGRRQKVETSQGNHGTMIIEPRSEIRICQCESIFRRG